MGWYTDSKYKQKIDVIEKGSKGGITLYAKWIKEVNPSAKAASLTALKGTKAKTITASANIANYVKSVDDYYYLLYVDSNSGKVKKAAAKVKKPEMSNGKVTFKLDISGHPEYAQGGEARPTPVWHGICAAILARTEWGVTDEAVLSAIACHTAGKAGMTQLDKILYLADMTSAERDWPGVEKLRKLEMKDLDAAMLAALKQTNGFVQSEGKPLDPESKAAYEDILAHSGQNEG